MKKVVGYEKITVIPRTDDMSTRVSFAKRRGTNDWSRVIEVDPVEIKTIMIYCAKCKRDNWHLYNMFVNDVVDKDPASFKIYV